MRPRAILLAILTLALACSACKKKEEALSLLVWEGYSDASFVHAFEQRHHCKVQASYMGSSDELVAKLRGGSASNYDVISPSSDVAASLVSAGLAAPLDLGKIPSYSQLSPKLCELPLVKRNGQTYGVPFVWGPNPILYDTTAFARPPDSWSIFWDPRHKGKISLWDELSSVYMAAQVLGSASEIQMEVLGGTEALEARLVKLGRCGPRSWQGNQVEFAYDGTADEVADLLKSFILDGVRVWRDMAEYDTSSAGVHPNWPDRFFATIVDQYLAEGHDRGGLVGNASCHLVSARALLDFALPIMRSVANVSHADA